MGAREYLYRQNFTELPRDEGGECQELLQCTGSSYLKTSHQ